MTDHVNHPAHYTHGGIETIDVIERWELPFHLANVVKYISRAGRKDPAKVIEDLKKARWYLDRHITKMEEPDTGPIQRQDPAVAEFRLMQGLAHLAAREAVTEKPARPGHDTDCHGGYVCEASCGREPAVTSDAYYLRHPLGSPERVQAVEEHNAAKRGTP